MRQTGLFAAAPAQKRSRRSRTRTARGAALRAVFQNGFAQRVAGGRVKMVQYGYRCIPAKDGGEMRKKDWLIIGGVLLLAALAFVVSRFVMAAPAGATVTIYLHGEVYASVSADDYQTITIDQGNGMVNVIVIDETGVRMEHSTCKNQICVKHGTIDPYDMEGLELDNWIICMPNGIAIEVAGGEENGR
jgi:hypothetical protein